MRIWPLRLVLGLLLPGLLALSLPGRGRETEDAQSHADIGIRLARSGDLAGAADELRRAVMLAPKNPEFLSTLGTVLAMDKKLEESTAAFRKALQFAPQDSAVRRYLAANLWQLHRYPEAKRELQIILREHPNDAQSRLLLGMVSENSGDYATAAKMLRSVPNEVEKQPESMAALARSYYHLHEQEKARAALQKLSLPTSNAKSLLLGAEIADQAGDYDQAEQLLNSISEPGGPSPDIRYRKATVQYHAGHFSECEKTLQLSDGSTGTAAAYNLLGWCDHRQNRVKDATRAFEQAIALAPADESNYLDLIKVLEAHHFSRVALDAANRAAGLFPNSAALFNRKGSIESRLSQFTEAITSYKQALQFENTNIDSWLGLARAQISAGLIGDATSTLTSSLARFPNEARFKVVYAAMLLKHANADYPKASAQAEQMLRQAIASDASNPEAFYELGKLELDDGRLTEACKNLERAAQLSPKSSQAHFVLYRAYRLLHRTADAARELETFKRLKRDRVAETKEPSSDELRN